MEPGRARSARGAAFLRRAGVPVRRIPRACGGGRVRPAALPPRTPVSGAVPSKRSITGSEWFCRRFRRRAPSHASRVRLSRWPWDHLQGLSIRSGGAGFPLPLRGFSAGVRLSAVRGEDAGQSPDSRTEQTRSRGMPIASTARSRLFRKRRRICRGSNRRFFFR